MDYQGKIFEIFQRLHFQEEYPGTGVGLALVKKAVDRLGGSVSVQSKIGEGTTFTVSIPAGKESQPTLLN
jgi:light-regulated signal transduction histidine kinase (bacteriophytochrome)